MKTHFRIVAYSVGSFTVLVLIIGVQLVSVKQMEQMNKRMNEYNHTNQNLEEMLKKKKKMAKRLNLIPRYLLFGLPTLLTKELETFKRWKTLC